jgi:hypothetical protein
MNVRKGIRTMTRATNFFISTVKPTADEFLSDLKNIRRGRLAAIVLDHMAEYWWWENKEKFSELSMLRAELTKSCLEYSIIRDVSDASKHCLLTRSSAKLSSSEQITRTPGLFDAPFGWGVFAEAAEVIVTLNDRSSIVFAPVVRSVLLMWEDLLR